MKRFAIVALSIATAFCGMPAWAGPAFVASPNQSAAQPQPAKTAEIYTVGCNNFINCPRNNYNGRRGFNDRRYDREDRYRWDRRYDRDRYSRNNNAGAVIGGLAAGAIIGGIIASQPRVRSTGNSHVDYCYNRYQSYRASDNTYQPTNGPRRQCG